MNLPELEAKLEVAKQELENAITHMRHLEGGVMLLNGLINDTRASAQKGEVADGSVTNATAPVRDTEVGTTEEVGGTPEGDVGPA